MKGNVDNLVTLCLDQIDGDRLALRRRIEESLGRLEKETLISRSGDNYFFLTNEERDINKEIKQVDLSSGEEAKLQGELIFEDVLKGQRKHRFTANKMDFDFNRRCDRYPVGNQKDGALLVSVITPLADDYEATQGAKRPGESPEGGYVLIRLGRREPGPGTAAYLQTEKYLRTRTTARCPNRPSASSGLSPRTTATAGTTDDTARRNARRRRILRRRAAAQAQGHDAGPRWTRRWNT